MAKRKVLVVDDETIFRRGLRHLIGTSGLDWEVSGEAKDGLEALDEIRREAPDLVITDIRMPKLDGIGLQERIRAEYPDIRCFVLSGYNEFRYAQRSLRYGARDYLLKPVDKNELYRVLGQVGQELEQLEREREAQRLSRRPETPRAAADPMDPAAEREHPHHAVDRVVRHIEEHYAEPITLGGMAELVYLNASYLSSLFKSRLGRSFVEILTEIRVREASKRLLRTDDKIAAVACETGFANIRHFNRVFKAETGRTPKEFREATNPPPTHP